MLYFLWTERAKRNKFFDDVYRGKTIQLRNKLARLNLSVDDTNSDGVTALMVAVHFNRAQTVRALIDLGCDVNKCREMPFGSKNILFNGYTALMIAVELEYHWIVRILVEDGHASIGLKNPNGRTVIQMASESNQHKLANYLLHWYMNPMGVHTHIGGDSVGFEKPERLKTGGGSIPTYATLPPGALRWSTMNPQRSSQSRSTRKKSERITLASVKESSDEMNSEIDENESAQTKTNSKSKIHGYFNLQSSSSEAQTSVSAPFLNESSEDEYIII